MQINESLTFGDLLIIPQYSEVESRSLVQTKVSLMAKSKGSNSFFEFRHPIIPANMKSIGSLDLLKQSLLSQGLTLLHRFDTLEEQVSKIKSLSLELERYIKEVADLLEVGTEDIKAQHWSNYIGVSLGVKQEDIDNAEVFYNLGVRIFCIDIAHGHSKRCGDMCKLLKEKYDGILLIAGNVATGEGAKYLWDSGADVVKCGIGSGSICLTRMEAGCGVAQIKALQDIVEVKNSGAKYFSKSIISDGGIVNNGDIPKALAFADMVMVGNMFSGCEETEGNKVIIDGVEYKEYAGSSTHKSKHIEGVVGLVHKKGKFSDILDKMMQGLRSGCSYVGAFNIGELKYKVKFNKITQSGLRESNHHDVKIL